MDFTTILFEKRPNGVAVITLNRPERLNAINRAVVRDVTSALEECRTDHAVRSIVLRGAGRAFCAGDDIRGDPNQRWAPPDIQERLRTGYLKIMQELFSLRKPTVAQIHGYACGAGLDISLACDFRIMASDARIAAIFVKRGLGGGCCYLLPRYVGLGKATEMLLLGEWMEAEEAQRWGIAYRVVPAQQLAETVEEFADRLAQGPTRSYALIKTARNQGLGADFLRGFEYQAYANGELILSEDAKEGPAAFREKRQPSFTGRWVGQPVEP
ncbi:MAG: enoyl-CoA hydratase/isomerase family protein [Chloroflexi bacterium]|nr:enoyl-CoA hydratase/isomerase family protein [Chloroflexota bacterium]